MNRATNSTVAFWGCIICTFVAPELWMKCVFAGFAALNIIVSMAYDIKKGRHG